MDFMKKFEARKKELESQAKITVINNPIETPDAKAPVTT